MAPSSNMNNNEDGERRGLLSTWNRSHYNYQTTTASVHTAPRSKDHRDGRQDSRSRNGTGGHIDNDEIDDDNDDDEVQYTTRQLALMLAGPFSGAIIAALDSTLVGTLGGVISASLGDMRLLSWLGSSFLIATCASQPIVGKLSDLFGRKKMLLFANVIFCVGNLICAVAQTESSMIAGRVISGIGGGCLGPTVSMIMSDIIPLRRRGVWQGFANICYGFGSGIGAPVGGWITEALSWRWAFAIQVPITIVGVALILLFLPETAPEVRKARHYNENTSSSNAGSLLPTQRSSKAASSSSKASGIPQYTNMAQLRRIDIWGTLSLSSFLVLLLLGLNSGGNLTPWSDPLVISSLCASAVLLGVFIYVEKYVATEPIIELSLFRTRTLLATWMSNWFGAMARFGLLFYTPLLFQAQGYSIAQTGLRFIPESVAIAVASVGSGAIMRATGEYYALAVCSMSLFCVALGLFASPAVAAVSPPAWPAFVVFGLMGISFSGLLTTTLVAMIASVDQSWQAVITSTAWAFRSTGGVIGITIASAVFQNVLKSMLWRKLEHRDDREQLIDEVQHNFHAVDRLDGPLREEIREIYIAALRIVFLVLMGLALLALVSISLMKKHKLHSKLSRRD